MTKILCTCPPMIRAIDILKDEFARRGAEVVCPEFRQTLSVSELLQLVPQHDGWIIGDDPATVEVFRAGKTGASVLRSSGGREPTTSILRGLPNAASALRTHPAPLERKSPTLQWLT